MCFCDFQQQEGINFTAMNRVGKLAGSEIVKSGVKQRYCNGRPVRDVLKKAVYVSAVSSM